MKAEYYSIDLDYELRQVARYHYPNASLKIDIVLEVEMNKVIEVVCKLMGLDRERVLAPGREGVRNVTARQLICWVADRLCGYSHIEIAQYLNRERTTVHSCVKQAQIHIDAGDTLITDNIRQVLRQLLYEA